MTRGPQASAGTVPDKRPHRRVLAVGTMETVSKDFSELGEKDRTLDLARVWAGETLGMVRVVVEVGTGVTEVISGFLEGKGAEGLYVLVRSGKRSTFSPDPPENLECLLSLVFPFLPHSIV